MKYSFLAPKYGQNGTKHAISTLFLHRNRSNLHNDLFDTFYYPKLTYNCAHPRAMKFSGSNPFPPSWCSNPHHPASLDNFRPPRPFVFACAAIAERRSKKSNMIFDRAWKYKTATQSANYYNHSHICPIYGDATHSALKWKYFQGFNHQKNVWRRSIIPI